MAVNDAAINEFAINAEGEPVAIRVSTFNQKWALDALVQHDSTFNQRWTSSNTANASFVYSLPLLVDSSFVWELILRVGALATFPLGWTAAAPFTFPLTLLSKVDAAVTFPLPMLDVDPVNREFEFSAGLKVNREFEWSSVLLEGVNREFEFSAGLLETVNREFEWSADLLLLDRVNREFRYVWSLLEESAVNVTGAIELELVKTAEIVPITSGTVEISEDSYLWTGTLNLAVIQDFDKFDFDDDVIVRIYGEEYEMVVDGKDRGRTGPAQVRASLRVISKTARAATPRADELTETFGQILASDAVEQVLGQSVDWQIIDWLIPAQRLAAEAADPVEIASQIVEAAGGLLETNPDGTFYVRNRYPVPVAQWDSATPDQVYLESDAIMSWSEGFRPQMIFNKFRIRDGGDATRGDRIVFEADEDDRLQGSLFVFPSPWRDINVLDTSDEAINATPVGDVVLEKEQTNVEFRDGSASLSFPVLSITEVVWKDLDIGPVNFELDSTTITSSDPVNKFSLADIKYTTRAKEFRTSSPVNDAAQFLVEDC